MTGAVPSPIRAATLELSQARLGVFDPRAAVDLLADAGINTVVCFALGYLRGEAYYPSAHAAPHPQLGDRDLFAEVLAAAHDRGLAVCAYVNSLFGGPEHHDRHPEWTQRWADGRQTVQGDAKALCPNSPYRRHITGVCAEVARRYEIAALYLDEPSLQSWCACPNCRARFGADTGLELPLELQSSTEVFAAFLDWRAAVVAEFVAEVGEATRAARPGVAFFAQHAFPLASTAPELRRRLFWGADTGRMPPQFEGWYRPSFYAQDIVKVSAALDLVGLEPWRRFVAQPVWWQGACVSYARSAGRGKPVLPLMEYPHFPWGLTRLPDDELAVNCADVVANGGGLWFPMYAPDAADRRGWEVLGGVFRDLDGALPGGARPLAPVAVLVSRRSAERFGRDAVEDRYLDDVLGFVQLLRELHVPHELLSLEASDAADLAGRQVLALPSAACLDQREAELLRRFVADGGALLATGWVGTHAPDGSPRPEPLLTDVLGARLLPEALHAGLGYLIADDGGDRTPVRDEQPLIELAGAHPDHRVLPSWDLFAPPAEGPTSPSVLTHSYGRGRVCYSGLRLGRLRRRFEGFETRELLQRLLTPLLGGPLPVTGPTLGPEVALHAWRSDPGLAVFLVNFTSLEGTGRVSRLAAQTFDVARDLVPAGATAESLRGAPVALEPRGDRLVVTVDQLGTWDCVHIR
jgi:hypothetical protein